MFVDTDMAIAPVPPFAVGLVAVGWSLSHWDWSAMRSAWKAATFAFADMSGSSTICTISCTKCGFMPSSTAQPFRMACAIISDSGCTD